MGNQPSKKPPSKEITLAEVFQILFANKQEGWTISIADKILLSLSGKRDLTIWVEGKKIFIRFVENYTSLEIDRVVEKEQLLPFVRKYLI